jgi:hypothetical protein
VLFLSTTHWAAKRSGEVSLCAEPSLGEEPRKVNPHGANQVIARAPRVPGGVAGWKEDELPATKRVAGDRITLPLV